MSASDPSETICLPAAGVRRVLAAIFLGAGASDAEARAISGNLVEANLAGHDSHGVVRVPRYLEAVRQGHVFFGRSVTPVLDSGSLVVLDGDRGFGQVLGAEAVRFGLERAREHGLALVALRHAGHLGRIGAWAELACAAGFASLHFVNVACSMLVAPFGGAARRMSTAPVTIGIPNPGGDDFLLDFATSKVAEGKVLVALKSGKAPPPDCLIDEAGRPTVDPQALYGPVAPGAVPNPRDGLGALLAMGDHKGSGLALACELLAGALTGSGATGPGHEVHNGMLSIYLAPERLDDGHGWATAVADYIDFVRACPPTDPDTPVMIPGDPERQARRERMTTGLPFTRESWESIIAAGEGVGLEPDDLRVMLDDHCDPRY